MISKAKKPGKQIPFLSLNDCLVSLDFARRDDSPLIMGGYILDDMGEGVKIIPVHQQWRKSTKADLVLLPENSSFDTPLVFMPKLAFTFPRTVVEETTPMERLGVRTATKKFLSTGVISEGWRRGLPLNSIADTMDWWQEIGLWFASHRDRSLKKAMAQARLTIPEKDLPLGMAGALTGFFGWARRQKTTTSFLEAPFKKSVARPQFDEFEGLGTKAGAMAAPKKKTEDRIYRVIQENDNDPDTLLQRISCFFRDLTPEEEELTNGDYCDKILLVIRLLREFIPEKL